MKFISDLKKIDFLIMYSLVKEIEYERKITPDLIFKIIHCIVLHSKVRIA